MTNVAIVLAGGEGSRLELGEPKQLVLLAGEPILAHTLAIFQGHPRIHEIVVVSRAEDLEAVRALAARHRCTKLTTVVPGGADRTGSSRAGVEALAGYADETKTLLHDAVRPLVSPAVIDRCLDGLEAAGAVAVVIPSADTLMEVDAAGFVQAIPDRARMRRAQTPQAFRLGVIRRAHARYRERGEHPATCDCGVVLQTLPDERVATVEGDAANIKITEPIDLLLAEQLLQRHGGQGR